MLSLLITLKKIKEKKRRLERRKKIKKKPLIFTNKIKQKAFPLSLNNILVLFSN